MYVTWIFQHTVTSCDCNRPIQSNYLSFLNFFGISLPESVPSKRGVAAVNSRGPSHDKGPEKMLLILNNFN